MSTDWFLFSPSHKRKAMVGSIGLGGTKVWLTEYGVAGFMLWAIEEHITDVVLVNEDDPRLDEDVL